MQGCGDRKTWCHPVWQPHHALTGEQTSCSGHCVFVPTAWPKGARHVCSSTAVRIVPFHHLLCGQASQPPGVLTCWGHRLLMMAAAAPMMRSQCRSSMSEYQARKKRPYGVFQLP